MMADEFDAADELLGVRMRSRADGELNVMLSRLMLEFAEFRAESRGDFDRINDHFSIINGRLGNAELRMAATDAKFAAQELERAQAAGVRMGKSEMLISRTQWKLFTLLAAGIGTVAGSVGAVIQLLASR